MEYLLHRMKGIPDAWDDTLDEIPIFFEGLFRPAYNVCGCLHAMVHPWTFSAIHSISSAWSPMNPPKYQLPVTTLIPTPFNQASSHEAFFSKTTNMLLVSSGNCPHRGGCTIRYYNWAHNDVKWPPAPASSAYQGCVTCGCASQRFQMIGRITMP